MQNLPTERDIKMMATSAQYHSYMFANFASQLNHYGFSVKIDPSGTIIVAPKEIENAVNTQGKEDSQTDGQDIQQEKGKAGVLRNGKRGKTKGSGRKK